MKWAGFVAVVLAILALAWWASSPKSTAPQNTTAESGQTVQSAGSGGTSAVQSETRTSSTVSGIVAGLSSGSRFAALYNSTGVAAQVTGKGPYTVFVPTNDTYAASSALINSMSATQKKRLVQYHVVAGKMLDIDAVFGGTHTALSKDTLNFNVQMQSGVAYVNSAYAIKQYKASNGVVYLISAVLFPPQTADPLTGSSGSPVPSGR